MERRGRGLPSAAPATRTALAVAIAAACALLAATPQHTHAQAVAATESQLHDFDVPASDLGAAVLSVGTTAGLRVFFDPERLAGLKSPGVRGRYTGEQALSQVLRGTGLVPLYTGPASVRLELLPPLPSSSAPGNASAAPVHATTMAPVKVTARSELEDAKDRAYRSAGSSSALSRDDIERFRGTSVGDIFQGTPGVLIGENRNSGGLDVNIRGMQGQGRVPVLVDGARQETTVYRGYAGVSSRTYVDPDLIGGIDIFKGPVMSIEGTGATGGAVVMRTLSAEDVLRPGQTSGIRVRGSTSGNSSKAPPAGTASGISDLGTYRTNCAVASLCQGANALPASFGSSEGMDRPGALDFYNYAYSIAAARRFENLDLVAAFAQRRQGNYYAGTKGPVPEVTLTERPLPFYTEVTASYEGATRLRGGERIVNSNNESNTQLLKARLILPDDQMAEFSYLRYASEYGELMPSQLIWLNKVRQTDNSEVTAHTVTGRYRWTPEAHKAVDLTANLWLTRTHSVNRNYSADIYETFSSPPEPERYKRLGGDFGNTSSFQGFGEHKLSYGVTFQREDIDTLLLPGQVAAATGRIGNREEYSAYANWTWKPRPEWTAELGLRHLRARTDDGKLVVPVGSTQCAYDSDGNCAEMVYVESVFCVDNDGDGACDPIHYTTRNRGTVPTYSLSWEPWRNGLQFYARRAEAMRMPSLFETTQGWSVQPALDVPLKPEHTINRELGLNLLQRGVWLGGDRLAAKLAYFRNTTHDYLTRTSPNTWEEGSQIFVMRNIRNVELHGTEATLEYDAGWAYTQLSGTRYNYIQVCHYGSYRRNECNDYGVANSYFNNMIPPKWHASATFGSRWLQRKLELGTRLTFMGTRNPTPEFNDDTARGFLAPVPWHAYHLVDLYASYRHSDRVSIDFNVDNVTNRYYLDALSLGLVPAPGRTARLGMTLSF